MLPFLLLLLLQATTPPSSVPPTRQEVMIVDSLGGISLIDPTTFQVIKEIPLQDPNVDIYGMTHDGARLIVNDRGLSPFQPLDETTLVHPADGSSVILGKTGYGWNIGTIEIDPTTGIVYATHGGDLYEIDRVTGAANFKGPIQGLKPFDCICGLAIDSQGRALGIGILGYALYALDLPHAAANYLGDVGFTIGIVSDAAFDASGVFYAAWAPSDFSPAGIYRVDMSSLTVSFVATTGIVPSGLAFGPATSESGYCSAKTTSLGCAPSLDSCGLASPTAGSGYEVTVTGVENHTNGRLIYSTAGASSNPFAGGTWCVGAPWRGTSIVTSGGTPKPAQDCSGSWSADMNTELSRQPGPQAGDTIWCQWIGRDRGFAPPDNYTLSSALQFTLLP